MRKIAAVILNSTLKRNHSDTNATTMTMRVTRSIGIPYYTPIFKINRVKLSIEDAIPKASPSVIGAVI